MKCGRTPVLALAALAAFAVGDAPAQTPSHTLASIARGDGVGGGLRIWTYAAANPAERTGSPSSPGSYHGLEHPFATWTVGRHQVSGHVETFSDCRVPGRAGSFDLRRSVGNVDPYLDLVTWEVRPRFDAGSGVGLHRFRWVERIDPAMTGITAGEVRVLLPANGSVYLRDAVSNMTRQRAVQEFGNEYGLRPYWRDPFDPSCGFYYNRLNIADVLSLHAFDAADQPAWGLACYVLDPGNADPGHLIVGSNPDAAGQASLEFGYDVVLAADHLENNGQADTWIPLCAMLLRSLPSVTPKEYAWWENVDFIREHLLRQLVWVDDEPPLDHTPDWAQTAVIGIGFAADHSTEAAVEAARIESFFRKYDAAPIVAPEFHYVASFNSWTDELYTTPVRQAFRDLMTSVRAYPAAFVNRAHVLTYLATPFFIALNPLPSHPLIGALAHNDDGQPYATLQALHFVDPSDSAFVAAFDQALVDLIGEGVDGVYFDNLFGDELRNYNQHAGADRRNHLDQISLVDRVWDVHRWQPLMLGEQSRLGNRYTVGAHLPCAFRAFPGGSAVPFIDALVHEYRLTAGAGDMLEQWFAHVLSGVRNNPAPTKRDAQNIVHDYMFGFVKGQLVVDGRTEYEVAPGAANPTIEIQIFQADPALHPSWADPNEVLGFEVLKDVADLVYPRMMWWRATTPALQHGRMLLPPYPEVRVAGQVVDEWGVIDKEYYFKLPGFSVPPGTLSTYETERYPVSFWALPSDPTRLTLFMGNPTYDAVRLRFRFTTADYAAMAGHQWNYRFDPGPAASAAAMPMLFVDPATSFDFSVDVPPLSFRRVTFERH